MDWHRSDGFGHVDDCRDGAQRIGDAVPGLAEPHLLGVQLDCVLPMKGRLAAVAALALMTTLASGPVQARPMDRSDTGEEPDSRGTSQTHHPIAPHTIGTTHQALHALGEAETGTYWALDESKSQQPGAVRKQWPVKSWSCTGTKTGEVADASIQQQLDPTTVWPRNGHAYSVRLTIVPRSNAPDGDACDFFQFLPQFNLGSAVPDAPHGAVPVPRCYQGDVTTSQWTKRPCHAELVKVGLTALGNAHQEWMVINDIDPGRSRSFPGWAFGTGNWQIYLPVRIGAGRFLGYGRTFNVPGCENYCVADSGVTRRPNEWGASISAVFEGSDQPVHSQLRQVQEAWANPAAGDVAARHGGLGGLGLPKSVGLSESARWNLDDFMKAHGVPGGHAYMFPGGWVVASDTDPNGGHMVSWDFAGWWLNGFFRFGPWLGWPTSDATKEGSTVVQHFEHGEIRGNQVCVTGTRCSRGVTPMFFETLRR